MIALEQTTEGVVLPIRAQPNASKNRIVGAHGECLKVAVMQAPEKGKANTAILKLLATSLGLKRAQFQLLAGETSQAKKILVSGISLDELRELLRLQTS